MIDSIAFDEIYIHPGDEIGHLKIRKFPSTRILLALFIAKNRNEKVGLWQMAKIGNESEILKILNFKNEKKNWFFARVIDYLIKLKKAK